MNVDGGGGDESGNARVVRGYGPVASTASWMLPVAKSPDINQTVEFHGFIGPPCVAVCRLLSMTDNSLSTCIK